MYFSLLNLFNLASKSHKDGELFVPSPDLPGAQAQRIEGSLERWEEGKSRERDSNAPPLETVPMTC